MFTLILFIALNLMVVHPQAIQKCNFGPSRIRPDSCCKLLPAFATLDLIRDCKVGDLYGENHLENPPCEPFNCIMQKNGYLNPDYKLNRLNIRSSVYNQYPPEWSSIIEIALTNCFAQLDTGSQCESKTFTFCFLHYMLLNCPASQWTFSKNCDDAKLFLQNCVPPSM